MPGLFNWGRKQSAVAALATPVRTEEVPAITSKVLPKFLAGLTSVDTPVLLNLGPVIGQNISFFGDRLSCKIFVEDLFQELEAHTAGGTVKEMSTSLPARLKHEPGTVDGILCWDVFDYLDKATGQAVAAKLVSLLRPGGVLHGFFCTQSADVSHFSRFIIDAPDRLRLKPVPAVSGLRRNVTAVRDINKMFTGLNVGESILLKTSTRETLFRKP